jgi:hypothetical protein
MDLMQITDYLAKKVFNGELTRYKHNSNHYIMLKNKQIYSVSDYGRLVESYEISPEDAFVYIDFIDHNEDESYNDSVAYLFPLIDLYSIAAITRSYLFKLGFHDHALGIYPATGLKYYAVVILFSDRLVIELTDIDIVATNTGLRKIVMNVLGKGVLNQKGLSYDQISNIIDELYKQKLFAGHTLGETYHILKDYYENHNTTLSKEVLAITNDYNRIFQPYRVVYDTTTRQQVLM